MARYVLKRVLFIIPTIIGISFIVFFILNLTPGSPGLLILGERALPEQVEALNESLGFNQPFMTRYFDYVSKAVRGNFGTSYSNGQEVMPFILEKFPVTLKLALMGVFFGSVIGISIGVLSAIKQYSLLDMLASAFSITITSIPTFWLALLSIMLFSLKLGLLPSYGLDTSLGYVLPVFVVSLYSLANSLRMTRTTMLEAIRQDYITTAKAKGANKKTIIFKHALKNAMLPVVTQVGIDFGYLLGGTVIVEKIFSINGIGSLVISSVNNKDIPMVMGIVIFISLLFMFVLLAVDVFLAYIDPRVKARYINMNKKKSSKKKVVTA